jgi:predicted TIM-barrel fold metal-dependent hydrolase
VPLRVDVEAHYIDLPFLERLRARTAPPREEVVDGAVRTYLEPSAPDVFQGRSARLEQELLEVGPQRLAAMDAAGIDIQLLSLNLPGCEQFEPAEGAAGARGRHDRRAGRVARAAGGARARERNDLLAGLVAHDPKRFVGLAALAPDPDAPEVAADELERCVRELGFRGWKVNSHLRDGYLDDPRYFPLLERAAALGVPVYLHPTVPHGSMIGPYQGYGQSLPGPALGFAAETALHSMRLIYAGIFDRLPELQVVLGHLGEGLYFWLYRLDFEFTMPWMVRDPRILCERSPSAYLRENFWPTTSGHRQSSSFLATYAEAGARMMFATDYPYDDGPATVAWLQGQPIPEADKERIFGGNAAEVFGLV